jgi:P27 family predicted phage terminase small subunit
MCKIGLNNILFKDMKGRKIIPDQIKVLKGTDQKCRLNSGMNIQTIKSIDEIKASNKSILKSKRAKKIFLEKANQLINYKMLSVLDLEQLVVYAFSLDELFMAMDQIQKPDFERFIRVSDKLNEVSRYVENPHLKYFRDLFFIVNKIGSDFGFSPVSRIKMKDMFLNNKEKNDEPFGDL